MNPYLIKLGIKTLVILLLIGASGFFSGNYFKMQAENKNNKIITELKLENTKLKNEINFYKSQLDKKEVKEVEKKVKGKK